MRWTSPAVHDGASFAATGTATKRRYTAAVPSDADRSALDEWKQIVPMVTRLVEGRTDADLDRRTPGVPMTLRETVHHIVEANVVAAAILTAALGSPGSVFDWSWMQPFGPWMDRMRYDQKPLAPTLRLLAALNDYVVAQVEPLDDGLTRTVRLRDAADTELREVTVANVLRQEAQHARHEVEQATRRRDEADSSPGPRGK